MAGKIPAFVYWDTNVFISYFTGRNRSDEEKRGIDYWAQLADDGTTTIVTSALTYAEVLQGRMSDEQFRQFDKFMTGGRVEVKDGTIGVMVKVRELREHFFALKAAKLEEYRQRGIHQGVPSLCTPDAIHIATAEVYDCAEFHTFDLRTKRRCVGLLRLALPAGYRVKITKPEAPPVEETPPEPTPPPARQLAFEIPAEGDT
jgi:predicted nucleic acid-binding protein